MRALACDVDWSEGWANNPRLKLLVDKLPPRSELRYECKDGLYYAELDGYVSFIYKADPSVPDKGFGGAKRTLILKDGTELSFAGGWSSRAGVANRLGFKECVDVAITDDPKNWEKGYASLAVAVTYEFALNAVWEFLPGVWLEKVFSGSSSPDISGEQANIVGRVRGDGEYIYIPHRVENPCETCKGSGKYQRLGENVTCNKCIGTGHHLPQSRLFHRKDHSSLEIPFLDIEEGLKWHISGFPPKGFEQVAIVLSDDLEVIYRLTNHIDETWWEATFDVQLPDGSIRPAKDLIWPSHGYQEEPKHRSTSVGDVVILENGTVWQCASLGWEQVEVTKDPVYRR